MKYLLLTCVVLASCMFGGFARAGDLLSQITSGKQDVLALAEVTAQEPEATHIRVLYHFPQSKNKIIQTTHIFYAEADPMFHIGGIYLVSLNKEKDGYVNANGIHQVIGSDYRTATLVEPLNGDLAALQWFMNSAGKDTVFFGMGNKMYVEREGVERLIYSVGEEATISEPMFDLEGFSLREIPTLYWGIAGLVIAMIFGLCFFFVNQFPDKKWMIPMFLLDGIVVVAFIGYIGWNAGKDSNEVKKGAKAVTETQAVRLVRTRYPDLRGYPSDTLPPKRIRLHPARDGWYLAFLQLGSGRPLIAARCFYVGNDEKVEERGMYQSASETTLFAELDPATCQASP